MLCVVKGDATKRLELHAKNNVKMSAAFETAARAVAAEQCYTSRLSEGIYEPIYNFKSGSWSTCEVKSHIDYYDNFIAKKITR